MYINYSQDLHLGKKENGKTYLHVGVGFELILYFGITNSYVLVEAHCSCVTSLIEEGFFL